MMWEIGSTGEVVSLGSESAGADDHIPAPRLCLKLVARGYIGCQQRIKTGIVSSWIALWAMSAAGLNKDE